MIPYNTYDTEELLRQARHELDTVYLPSRETSMVLTKIDEALLWLSQAPCKHQFPENV